MKHLLYILPFLLLFSCGKSEKFRINGELENGKDKIIYLEKLEVGGPVTADSARIRSGNRFSFSGKISEPAFYRLRLDSNNFITLLTEPGERMTIEASASNLAGTYHVSGSGGSELLKKLNDRLVRTKRQIDALITEFLAMEEGPGFEAEEIRINQELEKIIGDHRKFSIAFILDNIESLAAITALYQQIDDENYVLNETRDIQYLKIVAESLKKKYPSSPHVRALAADAENQERQYELFRLAAMAEQTGDVTTNYPDIILPGTEGDTVRLHSLPQRYILVLFGSSLDQTSVQYSRELIPIYRAYHGKGFQVYQVSLERDRQEWLNSIRFYELPWIHVAELDQENFAAARTYNVQQIPSNYLINRDAGIIATNISVPELRRRLSRALD